LICPNCGYKNPEGRRYCEECGERIAEVIHERGLSKRRTAREAARLRREAEEKGIEAERLERRRLARKTAPWMGLVALGVLAVILVVLLVSLAGGRSMSAPEKAVHDLFKAIEKKDIEGYLKLTDIGYYKAIKAGEAEAPPAQAYMNYDYYQVGEIKTRLAGQEGDSARVILVGGTLRGFWTDDIMPPSPGVDFALNNRTVDLAKVEGEWQIMDPVKASYPDIYPEDVGGGSEFPETEEGL
jgi:hypothetical protein